MSDEATTDLPVLGPETLDNLTKTSTATLTMQLLKRGIRNVWMDGPKPLDPGTPRIAGEVFTLRFIPMREDVSTPESYRVPGSMRDAIEAVPAGRIVVIDGRGEHRCGTLGDILIARLQVLGASGVVTDAAVRDVAEVKPIGLPVFCAGATAPPSITGLTFVDWQQPIGCGGVAVFPGDIVVGDGDGVVVVPRALAGEVARDGLEQERFERFVQQRVREGASVVGLYPPDQGTLADYQRWRDAGEP